VWKATARRAEALGYSTLLLPDLVETTPAPLTALAIAAASTTTLNVGTWVLSNDFHHPVLLAREAATLDRLSGGRFQLGLGAGRPDNGYTTLGVWAEPADVRVSKLTEAVPIINALLRGEEVSVDGAHYTITNAILRPPPSRKIPLLIAAGGRRTIELAAAQADTVVFSTFTAADLLQQLEWLKAAAGQRFPQIELALRFTIGPHVGGPSNASLNPRTLPRSADAIVAHLQQVRERFGISYIVVADHDAKDLAEVVKHLTTNPPFRPMGGAEQRRIRAKGQSCC
jgi:probable F420-dependent oxidoreductase